MYTKDYKRKIRYRNTMEGLLNVSYHCIKHTIRRYPYMRNVRFELTYKMLKDKFINDPGYVRIYNNWFRTKDPRVKPCLIRIDKDLHFTIDNVKIVTKEEHVRLRVDYTLQVKGLVAKPELRETNVK